MDVADPLLPLNCPSCAAPLLEYVTTMPPGHIARDWKTIEWDKDVRVYRCPKHGRFWMNNAGLLPEPI